MLCHIPSLLFVFSSFVTGSSLKNEKSTLELVGISRLIGWLHDVAVKPGFHIIAPVATVVAVVVKRVLTQKYFLSDASDTVFPYDGRCCSISLKLGMIGGGDVGSITNFWARIWRYFQNVGRCERTISQTSTSNRRYACPHGNTAQEKKIADS